MEDPTRQPVVVLLHDVPPFVPITAADVTLEKLRTAPAGSLTRLDQAIGRTPWRALTAGSWLNDESFEAGGALARMIRPDERALAVAVDEVINAGGQLSPGDYVDVMLFLRMDSQQPPAVGPGRGPCLARARGRRTTGVDQRWSTRQPGAQHRRKTQAGATARQCPHGVARRPRTAAESPDARDPGRRVAPGRAQRRRKTPGAVLGRRNRFTGQPRQRQSRTRAIQSTGPDSPPKPVAIGGGAAPRQARVEVIRGNEMTQQTP